MYEDFRSAAARVETLKRTMGIWPGIISTGNDYRLTFDPPFVLSRYVWTA